MGSLKGKPKGSRWIYSRNAADLFVMNGYQVERLPFLSQVRDMENLVDRTTSLVSLPSRVTVPPLEVKELCL